MASISTGEGALPSPVKLNWTAPKRSFFGNCYRIHHCGWYGEFTIEWGSGARFRGYEITKTPWSELGLWRYFDDIQKAQTWCEDFLTEKCLATAASLGYNVSADLRA